MFDNKLTKERKILSDFLVSKQERLERIANTPITILPVGASCSSCNNCHRQTAFTLECKHPRKLKQVKSYNVCDYYQQRQH